jgi:quinol monooxygenase YgiN
MAVGIRVKLAGVTEDQFDAVNAQVQAETNAPPGLIFHSSGPIEGGWGIIDFWESREAFDAFFGSRVRDAIAAAGAEMAAPPDIKEFPVHEYGP